MLDGVFGGSAPDDRLDQQLADQGIELIAPNRSNRRFPTF
jgi:hypothetical protein